MGREAHAHRPRVLRGRAQHLRFPERARPRRRLHERGFLPRHRGPGVPQGLRRPHLLHRVPGGVADHPVPHRRAAAQPGQVHLRRRGGLPPAAEADPDRGLGGGSDDGRLLPDRPDGGRRQPDQADVRTALRARGRRGRRGHDRLRAVRGHARHHLGADHQGGAAPRRGDRAGGADALALRLRPGRAVRRLRRALRRQGARPGRAGGEPLGRDLPRARAHVRDGGPSAHPDALLHGPRRQGGSQERLLRHRVDRLLLHPHLHHRLRRHDGGG